MKVLRSIAAAALVATAGGAVSVAAWQAHGAQQGTPSQAPRPSDPTRSPSRQEQAPPRQDDRERQDRRDRDQERDQRDRDQRDRSLDDERDALDEGRRGTGRDRLEDQRDANARTARRRAFALDDPRREAEFNRNIERLVGQERELLQRNQDLLRRLGDARAMSGDQRVDALAAVIQETLLEQERVLRYLADARGAWAGDGLASDSLEDDDDGTLRQDDLREDRRTPLDRPANDRGRDGGSGGGDRHPGRSDQPQPRNPR